MMNDDHHGYIGEKPGMTDGAGNPIWQPIDTAPHETEVWLYCPERGITNHERVELGMASHGRGPGSKSYHAWATFWQPCKKPGFPPVARALAGAKEPHDIEAAAKRASHAYFSANQLGDWEAVARGVLNESEGG